MGGGTYLNAERTRQWSKTADKALCNSPHFPFAIALVEFRQDEREWFSTTPRSSSSMAAACSALSPDFFRSSNQFCVRWMSARARARGGGGGGGG